MSQHRSENVPADVKRKLRQEAGFGCCRCGYPFFQYHHIIPWQEEEHFRCEDMMVLCPNCHDIVTHGGMSDTEQRKFKDKPKNTSVGQAKGLLSIQQKHLAVNIGDNHIVDVPVALHIDGENIIEVRLSRDGILLVSAIAYDLFGEVLFKITDNEWLTGRHLPWDLEAKWRHVKLRHKLRDIAFEIDARSEPVEVYGKFWKNGVLIEIHKAAINIGDGLISGCRFHNGKVGIRYQTGRSTFSSMFLKLGP